MAAPQHIESLDDPRLAAFKNLKDRDLAQGGGRFIAESEQVVRRLLASDFPIESVLVAQRRTAELTPIVPANVPLFVVPDAMMHQVVGFKFHSGVLACGKRKPPETLQRIMERLPPRATIVICPEIANTENLGSLIRIAAGFGADAMLLGERSCDPFYRQSIRVSMGTVFSLNLMQSQDLLSDLSEMKKQWGVEMIATVLDETAQPLSEARRGDRVGLLFGNEAQGLPEEILAVCDRQVTIPMKLGTDSLNVAIAAGVAMYHFTSQGKAGH
jgi:tRNA G18 (ribose-2'-O)-methylase SpoU